MSWIKKKAKSLFLKIKKDIILFITINLNKGKTNNQIIFLDTKIGTNNLGDNIISKCCGSFFEENNIKPFLILSTHILPKKIDKSKLTSKQIKLVFGTNILSYDMKHSFLWNFPICRKYFTNVCLMGVGTGIPHKATFYTKHFLKNILSNNLIHSVRSKEAERFLKSIGVNNVLYTSCPTLWSMTPEKCKQVNKRKGNSCIFSLTYYNPDKINDIKLINIIKSNYKEIYFLAQSKEDIFYLKSLDNSLKYKIVSSLEEYTNILNKNNEIDYVGTRLHGGIWALNHLKRTFIISVDNRATEIGNDTGLCVIERNQIEKINDLINCNYRINLDLPFDNIEKWKNQFKHYE